jgi:adenosylcobinamide-phosphate synthase
MANSLEAGHIDEARRRLSHLCARDGSSLAAPELARATVESLAENTSDAVVAPLIWAAVAGVPGVLGYRAANTLDAMVGYRSPRYLRFGWASALVDDVLNLIPARLTGVITGACAWVVNGSALNTWRIMLRDAGNHPSPNAGWCEASAAAALGVRLGGANVYHGEVELRPILGEGGRPVEVADIRRAIRLGRSVALAGAGVALALALVIGRRRAA